MMFSGLVCGVAAGTLYEPSIQRYLEKFGKKPAHLLTVGGALDDYFNAKDLAKKWGHNPPFLARYGRMLKFTFAMLCTGAVLVLLSQLLRT